MVKRLAYVEFWTFSKLYILSDLTVLIIFPHYIGENIEIKLAF